jgi:hypothetical protein
MPRRDINQIAASIVAQTTGEEKPAIATKPCVKNSAAVALGRLGGMKGGKARAAALSSEKRKEIAKKAAQTRWTKTK